MRKLEKFIKQTQKDLFGKLLNMFSGQAIFCKEHFILVKGAAPILLVAHLDTVHKHPVKNICTSADDNILMSPQGIGGDDRCGVYALVNAYESSAIKPYLLFTCNEEVGGVGAKTFVKCLDKLPPELSNLKCIVEPDRKGSRDAVYYDCDNPNFEKYITSKGFETAQGYFSDISVIAPALGVAAVNLSSGYYNAHTLHEYINRKELNSTLAKVIEIVSDSARQDFPRYEYIEKKLSNLPASHYDYWDFEELTIPKDLPVEYQEFYTALLDIYPIEQLEEWRKIYGDKIISEVYIEEFAPFYSDSYQSSHE